MNKLFKKIAMLAFGAVMAIGVGVGLVSNIEATAVHAGEETQWTLVKAVSDLKIDGQYIIAAKGSNFALSTTQNTNNRAQTAINKSGDTLTDVSDSVQKLTLKSGTTSGTYAFYTGSGYLYAASSSKNYLKTETKLSANSSWNISISATGVATIKATGGNTRNWMRYNSSNNPPLFSCYSSGQADICLYYLKTIETSGPKLTSISVSGDFTNKTYDIFSTWNTAGLTVTGTYDDENTSPLTEGVSFEYSYATPKDYFVNNATTLTVTACVGSLRSDKPLTIEGITVECEYNSIAEANSAATGTNLVVRGIVKSIASAWNPTYNNMDVNIIDENEDSILIYRIGTQLEVGDDVTIIGVKKIYNSTHEIIDAVAIIHSHDNEIPGGEEVAVEMTIAEVLAADAGILVIVRGIVATIDTEWSDQYGNMTVTITDGTNSLKLYRLATLVAVGDDITVTGRITSYDSVNQIDEKATAVINSSNNEIPGAQPDPEEPNPDTPEVEGETVKYTFSDYTAGTQYASDEAHELDEILTVTTTECHFTGELRIYSSDEHNGYAIFESTKPISKLVINAGNKTDTLNITSKDGNTSYGTVSVTSTSYNDYEFSFDSPVTSFKLDVAGTQQIRIKYISVTYVNEITPDPVTYTAEEFATLFLEATSVCDKDGRVNNITDAIWSDLEAKYNSVTEKDTFKNAAGNETGSVIEQAALRYDYIVGKYSVKDFAGRNPAKIGNARFFLTENTVDYTALIIVATVAILGVSALIIIKRRRPISE